MSEDIILKKLGIKKQRFGEKGLSGKRKKRGFKNNSNALNLKRLENQPYEPLPGKITGTQIRDDYDSGYGDDPWSMVVVFNFLLKKNGSN